MEVGAGLQDGKLRQLVLGREMGGKGAGQSIDRALGASQLAVR
jgi:hypothetical protein